MFYEHDIILEDELELMSLAISWYFGDRYYKMLTDTGLLIELNILCGFIIERND